MDFQYLMMWDGTTRINDLGIIEVKIKQKWYDYETGYNFIGEIINPKIIEKVRPKGITGHTPEDYIKYGKKMFAETKKAKENYNPSRIHFSEFDVAYSFRKAEEECEEI